MHTHELDLTSLTFGVILTAVTGLLAVSVWTDAAIDLGLVVPAALLAIGTLVLVAALVRRPAAAAQDQQAQQPEQVDEPWS